MSTSFSYLTSFLAIFSSLQGFEIHGHRGMAGVGVENTLQAFQEAIEKKADVLELDLHLTKDFVFVIHHDPRISIKHSLTFGGRLLNSLNVSELSEITLEGNKIPTLYDLVKMIQSSNDPEVKNVKLNLEIKSNPYRPHETLPPSQLAEKLVHELRAWGFSDRVYYTSFDPQVLKEIRALDPHAEIGFLYSQESLSEVLQAASCEGIPPVLNPLVLKFAQSIRAGILLPEHTFLESRDSVSKLQEAGFRVIPWTVNDPIRQKELIEMKVDGIITDYPQVLRKVLDCVHKVQIN